MSEMTREQRIMAVAVARDAILQLRLPHGAPEMEEMTYLNIDIEDGELPEAGGNLQDYVDTIQPHCRVCQIGAMFLSLVRLYDGVPTDVIQDGCIDEYEMRRHLGPVFGEGNLLLMEHAFEGFTKDYGDFAKSYSDPQERAVAIFENVVENDGEFLPQGREEAVDATA